MEDLIQEGNSMLHTNTLSSWLFPQINLDKWKRGFLIYQYIFNCDHSYKLKTGISSHLHEKVANGPQRRGTRTAECWLFSSFEEAAAAGILQLSFGGSQVGSETQSQMLARLHHFGGQKD